MALCLPITQGCGEAPSPKQAPSTSGGPTQTSELSTPPNDDSTEDPDTQSTSDKQESGTTDQEESDPEKEDPGKTGAEGDTEGESDPEKENPEDKQKKPVKLMGVTSEGGCIFTGGKKNAEILIVDRKKKDDESDLKLLMTFDDMKVGSLDGPDKLSCTLRIDLKWPAGRRLRLANDYSTLHDLGVTLPEQNEARAEFQGYEGFVGRSLTRWKHVFNGEMNGDLNIGGSQNLRSDCSGAGQWVLYVEISAKSNKVTKEELLHFDISNVGFALESAEESKDCAAPEQP